MCVGFCAFYCYDGLFRERPFEILGYAVAVFIIIVYIIVNYGVKMNELEDPLRLVCMYVCVCVCVDVLHTHPKCNATTIIEYYNYAP